MISFAICEDEKILARKYKREIDKFMMKYDIDYNCYYFSGYDDVWEAFVRKNKGFKVYLLDIKTAKGSGLDAARIIREEYNDWASMIMIITAYQEYKYDALSKRLMLVDFINKLDECEERLQEDLHICLSNYDDKYNAIKYKYKNTDYNIELRQINAIEKEPDSKRCVLKTTYGEYFIQGTLSEVLNKLDNRFRKVHRSQAINIYQILSYNQKTNVITFKDKTSTKLVSREKKKEVVNYARGIY